jgi:cytosine/adenosine deaminase-related metal-dependent hydrolase
VYGLTCAGANSIPELLSGYNLLGSDILLSHANGATEKDAQLLTSAGAYISSTPDTELQMGLGMAMAFRPDLKKISSFGVDCHTNNRSGILGQMHLGLQTARGFYNQQFVDKGLQPLKLRDTVEDAFKIGTIQGARAVNMEDQIGSLAEGKLADVVIFNGMSPGMVCASEHDPVAAIVSHASIQDIETVIVNGVIRKEKGRLSTTTVDPSISSIGRSTLDWDEIATELIKSRSEIQKRIEKLGMEVGKKTLIQSFHIDESKFVSEV